MPALLAVRVTPKAGRDEIAGWREGELHVRVAGAAEGGKANAAACALLAKTLGVPKTSVRVVRGETARHKQLAFETLSQEQLNAALGDGAGRDGR